MHRPPRAPLALLLAGPLLVHAACSGDDGGGTALSASDGASASASASASSTGAASESDGASTSADTSATDSATASASASATDSATAATTDSATDSDSDSATDTAASATDTTSDTTGATSDTTTGATSDTTQGCPEGQEGCPCQGGLTCAPDLVCDGGLCVAPPPAVCGDGKVDPGEECDDGDGDDLDGCTSQCKQGPVCPAGTEGCPCQGGLTCDPGLVCQGGTCAPAPAVCGNGKVEPGEECDDGNQQAFDACSNQCKNTNFGVDPCGFPLDGVWLDINYKNAGSIYSPSWTYSATPGFGEAQWAPQGKTWPEINAKGPPVMSYSDPIGTVVDISSGKWIRIMLGLGDLISYEYATVCITGRSISVGSSVTVDLRNPALGLCGGQTSLSNSWQVHAGGVTLPSSCFAAGNDFQALQIEPTGGSGRLGLRSARITLHKPVF